MTPPTVLTAMSDAALFRPWFRDPATWSAWRAFLAALFGLPMTPDQLAIYRQHTGRQEPPSGPFGEAWLICGRRAGKSFMLALVAVYLATFRDWRPHLAPGECATVVVIAADRRQARTIFRYARALLRGVPMLRSMIRGETRETIELERSVAIEVHTASFRTTRGYTVVAALLDEIAFWPTDDAASPDTEIIAALRPAMSTVPGAMLLCASSPYARRGALWDAYRRHHGQDGPVLVWRAATRAMNPTVAASTVDAALAEDPARAAAEYLAEFRSDVESYIAREVVEACIEPGVRERPPQPGTSYSAFVDPSGGSSDSMTVAVAHRDGTFATLDAIREVRPPFSPEGVVQEFAELLRRYAVTSIMGDRYGGEWCREPFRRRGIEYRVCDRAKSDLYRDLLPRLNSRTVDLLDSPRLIAQLCGLERKTSRGGKDSIDHPPGQHDDLANAAAGVLVSAVATATYRMCDPDVLGSEAPGYLERYAHFQRTGMRW